MDELLERDDDLAALVAAVDDAGDGAGSVVLVSGEAGSGKSALVRAWVARVRGRASVLVGWCDDLSTARAHAPLHDVAGSAEGLGAALESADPGTIFDAVHDALVNPLRPTVLVLEDVHWADEATLDVVRHLVRRIRHVPAVLALTYRDDVGTDHPLVRVLGNLAGVPIRRVRPAPFTAEAVARLGAGRDVDVDAVLEATGGNAFLVTEVLAHRGAGLADSIRDAVLGRVAGLGTSGRDLVHTLAVVPGTLDLSLVDRLSTDHTALAELERHGVVVVLDDRCRFRHELLRLAVVSSLGSAELRFRHRRVLGALLAIEAWSPGDPVDEVADPARLVHFAAGAGDVDVVVSLGPHAAGVAHRAGAHDIADRIQRAVLDHGHRLDDEVRARLDHERAWTMYSLGRYDEAVAAANRVVRRHEQLGDGPEAVRALITASRMSYMANDQAAAVARAGEAVARALEDGSDDELLAEATVAAAAHAALMGDADALDVADQAVARSRTVERLDLESLARTYRGVALLLDPRRTPEGIEELGEACELGRRSGDDEAHRRAVLNLLEAYVFTRDPRVDDWLARARDMDDGSRDWDGFRAIVQVMEASVRVDRGQWDEAEGLLEAARLQGLVVGVLAVYWSLARARLAVRRGEPGAEALVAEAAASTTVAQAQQFPGWMVGLRAEHAWLHDREVDVVAVTDEIRAIRPGARWSGDLAVAVRRVGIPVEDLPWVVEGPWKPGAVADHAAAVTRLHEAGLPYDEALASIERGRESDLRHAIELLDGLGAMPAAALARRRLAALGVASVPRGPNRATRANPAGLTPRQVDVLELLVQGCSNVEIAERLVLSVRTVEDHVSGVLARLDVTSRDAAAHVGADLLGP